MIAMHTEEQARKLWCPMVRYLATFRGADGKLEAAVGYNRGAQDSGMSSARCVASECAMWRWAKDADWISRADKEFQRSGKRIEPERGYCGLAGKPEFAP